MYSLKIRKFILHSVFLNLNPSIFKVIFTECLFPYHIYIYLTHLGKWFACFFQHTLFKKQTTFREELRRSLGKVLEMVMFFDVFFKRQNHQPSLRGAPKKNRRFWSSNPSASTTTSLGCCQGSGRGRWVFQGFSDPEIAAGGNIFVCVFFVGGRGIEVFLVGLWLDFLKLLG